MLLFDHSGHLALATLELAVKSGFRPFARQGSLRGVVAGPLVKRCGALDHDNLVCEAALRA